MKKNETRIGIKPIAGATKYVIQKGKKKKTLYVIKHKDPAND